MDELEEKKVISNELEKTMKEAFEKFTSDFVATLGK